MYSFNARSNLCSPKKISPEIHSDLIDRTHLSANVMMLLDEGCPGSVLIYIPCRWDYMMRDQIPFSLQELVPGVEVQFNILDVDFADFHLLIYHFTHKIASRIFLDLGVIRFPGRTLIVLNINMIIPFHFQVCTQKEQQSENLRYKITSI